MALALVRIKTENRIVETEKIVNFCDYLANPNVDKLYTLKDKGRKMSCSILAVGETEEELNAKMDVKRLRYAVFNKSDLIDEVDLDKTERSDEERSQHHEAKNIKKQRKKHKKDSRRTSSKSTKNIVAKHLQARHKENFDQSNEGPMKNANDNLPEKKRDDKNDDNVDQMELPKTYQHLQDEIKALKDILNVKPANPQRFDMEKLSEKSPCYEKSSPNQSERSTSGYSASRPSTSGHSTSRPSTSGHSTSRPSTSGQSISGHSKSGQSASSVEDRKINDLTNLGGDCYVKTASYEKAMDAKDASKFVTTLAYGVWGYSNLSERCVRRQKNVKKPPLSPAKVSIITYHFKRYLKSRNYPDNLFWHEVGKVNSYLGRAITGAKRHLTAENENDSIEN